MREDNAEKQENELASEDSGYAVGKQRLKVEAGGKEGRDGEKTSTYRMFLSK